jgi:two-component system sensor histidine kinase VicK
VTKEREIDRAKTEFVSLASHQLRTPPTAIKWLIELILSDKNGKFTESQKKSLGYIGAANERMIKIINSLLDVSRIELGKFSFKPVIVDINLCAQEIAKELKFSLKKKNLRLIEEYSKPKIVISTDANLLKMVIQNLLTNAINYSHEKGKITMSISQKNKGESFGGKIMEQNSAVLSFSDEGCGIPKKQCFRVFTKLFRADNAGKTYNEGNGLGLYIVKYIVDGLHGNIWFDSEENKGTTFYVAIPVSKN